MLQKLAKHHSKWVSMVVNMGCNSYDAEDIVQELYIRLHRLIKDENKIMFNDDINRYFVYVTLRNMFLSYKKNKKKVVIYPLFEVNDKVDDDSLNEVLDENAYFQYLIDKIDSEVSTWDLYDKRLFEIHFKQGYSQREISRRSGIGLSSINNSCVNYKNIIKELMYEDIEDYNNKEFNLKQK